MPITGTHVEIASVTLLKAICQPPQANVVAHIKNMAAFTTNKKYTLFCSKEAQNLALSCSSPLEPCVINKIITDIIPIAISTIAVVLYLFGMRNCSLIAISFIFSSPIYLLAVAVVSVVLAAVESKPVAVPPPCLERRYSIIHQRCSGCTCDA